MMKSNKIFKNIIVDLLIFILGIDSFAAVVSDNDGSAFITKAEFETMKKEFVEQVDNYNKSIDGKIDGAIAAYLAGLRMSKVSTLENYVDTMKNQYYYANAFANKQDSFTSSNDEPFSRAGWWLFKVWGWNLGHGDANGMVNIVNGNRSGHSLKIRPTSVNSKKFYLKKIHVNGNDYYGPYDQYIYSIEQQITAEALNSFWNQHQHYTSPATFPNLTFDFRSLTVSGTTALGSYDTGGWGSITNIIGRIILKYERGDINRRWGAANASGSCNSSTSNYAVDYDERYNLTQSVTKPGTQYTESGWGSQCQNWYPSSRTAYYADQYDKPSVTLHFNIPKIINIKNNELCNPIASKLLDELVPIYAGMPITKLPGSGKIKLKYRYIIRRISDNVEVSDTATLCFKSKQFSNAELSSETEVLYETTEGYNEWTTCEFDINDAKSDGSTVLYVKAAPSNSGYYVAIEIDGNPTYTQE